MNGMRRCSRRRSPRWRDPRAPRPPPNRSDANRRARARCTRPRSRPSARPPARRSRPPARSPSARRRRARAPRGPPAGWSSAIARSQAASPRSIHLASLLAELEDHPADVAHAGVGQREVRIELDRLLEHLQREVEVLAPGVAAAAQVVVVGLQVLGGLARDRLLFLGRQRDAQGLRDAARDLVLDREDVLHLAGRSARPRRECRVRVSTSCAVMRRRLPARRMLPSST